jgi:hypothetical protein
MVRPRLARHSSLEEPDHLGLQNDRAKTSLTVDAKRPGHFIKVADRASDQLAIARASQEARD